MLGYRFIVPNEQLSQTKVLAWTPSLCSRYTLTEKQAVATLLRDNKLISVFTGLTCYSLQSHARAAIPGVSQVETDDLYVGIDNRGAHHVLPVQVTQRSEKISLAQTEHHIAFCASKFPDLFCQPVSAQFIGDDVVALFLLEDLAGQIRIASERHYKIVDCDELFGGEIEGYCDRLVED